LCRINIDPGLHSGLRKKIANWGLEIILSFLGIIFLTLVVAVVSSFSYTHSVEQKIEVRMDDFDKTCLTKEKLEKAIKDVNTNVCERMDIIEKRLQDIKTFMQLLFSSREGGIEKEGGVIK
jgi:cell division protein FtsB